MNWRRLAEAMLHRTVADDNAERLIKGRRVDELEVDVQLTNDKLKGLSIGAHARLDSYRRVHIGRQ